MHRTEGANNLAGLYTAGPPPTTITADALNSIQEEIAGVIEYNGIAVQTAATDTRNQLLAAMIKMMPTYDAVVTSQSSWDTLIERTGANAYQFKDDYKSIFVKVGDYILTLSGGDTWGALLTNVTTHLEFERGAAISFGATQGYLNINTNYACLKNIHVKGVTSSTVAVNYCFYINATYVICDSCRASARLSNTTITGFFDLGGSWLNKYINCDAYDLNSSGIVRGYYNAKNLSNCNAYDLECTGAGAAYGYASCLNINTCMANGIDSENGNSNGFYNCSQISGSKVQDIDTSGAGTAYGFNICSNISSSIATDIQSAVNVDTLGFYACNQVSGCTASVIDATGTGVAIGFDTCSQVSGCYAYDIDSDGDANVIGFDTCSQVSGCYAYDIATTGTNALNYAWGFYTCNQISSSQAKKIDANLGPAHGFSYCSMISACYADDIDSAAGAGGGQGFVGCQYGSSLSTSDNANSLNDYIDTTDAAITNKFSCHPTNWT